MKISEMIANIALCIPAVSSGKAIIVNDVKPSFIVETEDTYLKAIVRRLLETVVLHSSGFPIKVWAKQFHNLTVLHFKYKDDRPEAELQKMVAHLEPFAERLGGCLYLTSHLPNDISIAFTFLSSLKSITGSPYSKMHALQENQKRLSA